MSPGSPPRLPDKPVKRALEGDVIRAPDTAAGVVVVEATSRVMWRVRGEAQSRAVDLIVPLEGEVMFRLVCVAVAEALHWPVQRAGGQAIWESFAMSSSQRIPDQSLCGVVSRVGAVRQAVGEGVSRSEYGAVGGVVYVAVRRAVSGAVFDALCEVVRES